MKHLVTYVIGLLFGLGITVSGMGNPAKVVNFFDFAGIWDPSLAFVMGGALIVAMIGYRIAFRRTAPLFEAGFAPPTNTSIDRRLIAGSIVFGIGWGISGFCPGGALPMIGTGNVDVLLFFGALVVGIWVAKLMIKRNQPRQVAAHNPK